MANNTKFKDWTSIINAVQTPLGFLTLIVLIIDGIFVGVGAFSNNKSIMWGAFVLLVSIVLVVVVIAWNKPHALYHPRDRQSIRVNLNFPKGISPFNLVLDTDKCILEVCNTEGKITYTGRTNLQLDHGGWTFVLGAEVAPSDTVRLELVEQNGRKWRVNPFSPYTTTQNAIESIHKEKSQP
ncbi:hypothetical protein HYR99_32195 [Candidatus Poribacteria bacterium]|nr:hypothetical protein [Candidatus Poribacteria bacterium]